MSRQTVAKSRADKVGGKGNQAPTPAVTREIIPGKYNDQDWNLMCEHDDGDEFIQDIVSEVCTSALDIIYEQYIQRQLIPYTVTQAKDAILQIIEWQFLARDIGEPNMVQDAEPVDDQCEAIQDQAEPIHDQTDMEVDQGWLEDDEPAPAVTDCWAQGSVPRLMTPRVPSRVEEDAQGEMEAQLVDLEAGEEEGQAAPEAPHEEEEQPEGASSEAAEEENISSEGKVTTSEEQPSTEQEQEHQQPAQTDSTQTKSKKKKFKPHMGRLPSPGVGQMTESLEDTEMKMWIEEYPVPEMPTPDPEILAMPSSCYSILKLQNGRPPGNRDIMYDEAGNVVGMTRIKPNRLPSHRVRTTFHIVDPAVEAAQARLEAMRTGRYVKTGHTPKPPTGSMRGTSVNTSRSVAATALSHDTNASTTSVSHAAKAKMRNPLPPPLIEQMDLSPGVVVKEGERIKKGPRQRNRKADLIAAATEKGLKPIAVRANIPTVTVQDLLEHQTPIVRPLNGPAPIPPIKAQMGHAF